MPTQITEISGTRPWPRNAIQPSRSRPRVRILLSKNKQAGYCGQRGGQIPRDFRPQIVGVNQFRGNDIFDSVDGFRLNGGMCNTSKLPTTLIEAITYFADPQIAHDFMVRMRWVNGEIKCPCCGSDQHGFIATRRVWQCKNKDCKKQFSVKVGTIFEDSPLSMSKWIPAVWLIANCKNGVSSHKLARSWRHAKNRVVYASAHSACDANRLIQQTAYGRS